MTDTDILLRENHFQDRLREKSVAKVRGRAAELTEQELRELACGLGFFGGELDSAELEILRSQVARW